MYKIFRLRRRISVLAAACFCIMISIMLYKISSPAPDACCSQSDLAIPILQSATQPHDEMVKRVYLTFDDGPSVRTEEILKILNDENVPASFFVVLSEDNEKYWPLVKEIEGGGHCLALHSASHSYKKIYSSSDAFWMDISKLKENLSKYAVAPSQVLRFPGGSTNTVSRKYGGSRIMKELTQQAEERGYTVLDWNVCAQDAAGGKPSPDKILHNIIRDSEGKSVCVVLMHDTHATKNTVAALPEIIQWFRDNGYEFCTVDTY